MGNICLILINQSFYQQNHFISNFTVIVLYCIISKTVKLENHKEAPYRHKDIVIFKVYKYRCHKHGSYFETESSHNPERIKLVAVAESIKEKAL